MRSSEIKAVGQLAGDAISGPATLARGVHSAVAGRTFGILGILGAPVRIAHDAISGAVYKSVQTAIGALPRGGSATLAQLAPPQAAPLADSIAGSIGLGVLNGAIGDRLSLTNRDLALELSVRHRGRVLTPDRGAIEAAIPEAGGKLAIFVHGLCGTDETWQLLPISGRQPGRRSYGSRLRDELGFTPLYVRYNTGRHISENGLRLAEVVEGLVKEWPVRVEQIALIGHSMGGLVSRSACHYGERSEHRWVERVGHVICLGSPHLGAPLERAANVAGWTLGRLRETQPFAELVNGRSAGIKDLRYGSCLDEDWSDCDPDEFLTDRCREFSFLPSAGYYFIGATLTRDPDSAVGKVIGDVLVQYPSASGSGPRRKIPFELDNGMHLGGVNHIQLLNHPAVYEKLRLWLGQEPSALQHMQ
jgi:pimeloyl-ACP methyl ester carboxylesterase